MSEEFTLLQRVLRWMIGERTIARLMRLDQLKRDAETQARMAALCGRASLFGEPPLGLTAEQERLVWHDKHASEFNRLRYWWMRPIPLRSGRLS